MAKEEEVVLPDGRSLRVRPVRKDDARRIEEFFYRMSPKTRRLRFLGEKESLTPAELEGFTTQDPPARYALAATLGEAGGERIVGVSRWYPSEASGAPEFIVVVEDAMQFRGIGTALFERLVNSAVSLRIGRLSSRLLPESVSMVEVLEESGLVSRKEFKDGLYLLELDLRRLEGFTKRADLREHAARSAGVRRLLYPKSVAVIGASRRPESVGGAAFRNMLECNFDGPVFPVNPKAASIGGVLSYPTVLDVPGDVDMAVVVVPALAVPEVAEQCGLKGVRSMVVISAGFGESGEEGRALEEKLRHKAAAHGIRLLGPNCLGVLNAEPGARLNATFSPVMPPSGCLSICTQSGALGLALLDYAKSLDLGIAHFVSVGNRVDISSNDMLEFWEDDPNTGVILLYLESFGNPRRFSRIARRVSAKKPIIAVKAGRSRVGARAASSHTGALAASDVAVEAMFRQAGVIRVGTMEDMFTLARAMAGQPAPRGGRVGILTNAGGPGVLAADAAEGWGLEVPPLGEGTVSKMREALPSSASLGNPVDMIASATPESYGKCLSYMLDDPNTDAVIVIYIPPLVTQPEDVASAIGAAMDDYTGEKPVLACFMMLGRRMKDITAKSGRRVPVFTFPEDAVQAVARARQYTLYRGRAEAGAPVFRDIDSEGARKASLPPMGGGGWLMPEAAMGLLGRYGIRAPEFRVAYDEAGAAAAAAGLGFPVALKLRSNTIIHKSDVGGIALGLGSKDEVRRAFASMQKNVEEAGRAGEMEGVLVQPMVGGGREVVVGMSQDPLFGPLVMVGLGGVQVELLKDIAFSLHPLGEHDPERMLAGLKSIPLLTGYRNSPPSDVDALKEALLRFSALIEDFPELEEMEINPLLVMEKGKGCLAIDVRARAAKA